MQHAAIANFSIVATPRQSTNPRKRPNMDSGESSEGELLVLVLALISPLAVG